MITGFAQTQDSLHYTIVQKFPSPGPSPQGLAWDGDFLWVSDDSMRMIYKLHPVDGSIISSFNSPGSCPRGLTWDGNYLWCSDNDSVKIFKIDIIAGAVISSIPATANNPPQIHGLTWDGQYLYYCFEAGWSSQIMKIDIADTITTFFTYTTGFPKGLAFDGKSIWNCSDAKGSRIGWIDQYDYINGLWLNAFDTPGFYPTGLTFDGNYFWIVDNSIDSLFQIEMKVTSIKNIKLYVKPEKSFHLHQNFPNPFNSNTSISFEIPFSNFVILQIFDIKGEIINTLIKQKLQAGQYTITWNGVNNFKQKVPSGVYFYSITSNNYYNYRKMIMIK